MPAGVSGLEEEEGLRAEEGLGAEVGELAGGAELWLWFLPLFLASLG